MAYHIYGVIRVGSLEQELSIYEIGTRRGSRLIDRAAKTLPLGNENFETGKISYNNIEKLSDILQDFLKIMKSYKVTAYKAYVTSAFRDLDNIEIFIDRIKARTGISPEILSNSEQRFINYKALSAMTDIDFDETIKASTAIIDSGYGSMQISLFDKDKLVSTENLPLSSVKIAETVAELPISRSLMLEEIKELAEKELGLYRRLYLKKSTADNLILIGEGTRFLFKPEKTERGKSIFIDADAAKAVCDRIASMNLESIEDQYSVNTNLAKVLVVMAVICKCVTDMCGAKHILIPDCRFADGAAVDYAEKNKLIKIGHDFEEDIIAASRNIAKKYKCSREHSAVVEDYALSIFDSMKKIGGFSKRDRLILRIAAILHSCGKFINIRNSAQACYNIILSTEIIGLSHNEREITANVVKYNTEEFDYHIYKDNAELMRVAKLTAILKIANALDRGHKNKLGSIKINVNEKEKLLVINATSSADLSLEKIETADKGEFFGEIFGYMPVLRQKKI